MAQLFKQVLLWTTIFDVQSSSLMGFLNLLDLPFGDKYKAAFSRVLQKLYIKVIIST